MRKFTYFFKILFPTIFLFGISTRGYAARELVRPNILLIIVDDLKPVLGCYGDKLARTPNIDQLARSAYSFGNNHCQQALSSPSRSSFLTGKRPDHLMVWEVTTKLRYMIPNIVTMPQYFKHNGYETAAIGKVFDPRSVDADHDSVSWSIPYENTRSSAPQGDKWVFAQYPVSTESPDIHDSLTLDGQVLLKGLRQLNQFRETGKPFFLAIGFNKPNLPFVAPKNYWDLYNRDHFRVSAFQEYAYGTPDWVYKTDWDLSKQYEDIDKNIKLGIEKQKELIHGYYACVSFIDHQIGLLITHLKELKLFDNTIIVICGDQGMHLGDHGVWSIKSNLEEATRTPLIISHSNQFIGKTNTPTELLDIFPTLCGMAGISPPEGLEGKSLLPVMQGIQKQIKPYALSQIQRLDDYMGYAFRDERYRYVVWMRNNFRSYYGFSEELIVASELYDYKADYAETVNLINRWEYMNVVQKFRNWSVDFFISQEKSHINMYHFLYD